MYEELAGHMRTKVRLVRCHLVLNLMGQILLIDFLNVVKRLGFFNLELLLMLPTHFCLCMRSG